MRRRELRVLCVGERDSDLVEAHGVEHFERLPDLDEVRRVVEVQERATKLCGLDEKVRTRVSIVQSELLRSLDVR